jgi:hypothetical protein
MGKVYIFSYITLSRLCISGNEYEKLFQTTLHGLFTPILGNAPKKRYESSGVLLKN